MAQTAQKDALDILVADHREVEQLIDRIKATGPADTELRAELSQQAITELVRHSIAEEELIYPRLRESVPDGGKLADDDIEEHQEVERLLAEIERTDPGDARFAELWDEVSSKLAHHIEDEETEDFPGLRQHVAQAELNKLASKLEKAKEAAPTHPHPLGPSTPPLNIVANRGAAMFDKLRDALRGDAG